jgi:hypothetical protein
MNDYRELPPLPPHPHMIRMNDYRELPPLPPHPNDQYEPDMRRYIPVASRLSKTILGNKTELCFEHKITDKIDCGYAHSIDELQPCKYGMYCSSDSCKALLHNESNKRRLIESSAHLIPRLCRNFSKDGYCSYGNRCNYIHWSARNGLVNFKK